MVGKLSIWTQTVQPTTLLEVLAVMESAAVKMVSVRVLLPIAKLVANLILERVRLHCVEFRYQVILMSMCVVMLLNAVHLRDFVAPMPIVSMNQCINFVYMFRCSMNCALISRLAACGIGCQYGDCTNIPHWIDNNPPPSIPEYTASVCMANAYNHFHEHGDKHPVCTAKDVHSFTASLVGNSNPTSCKKGEMISVYYSAAFTVNSAKGRHDIAMYTARDALCNGDAPSPNDGNCANDGASCTVTVLGDADIAMDWRIKYDDKKGGHDSCADIDRSGTFQFAPRQMEIPCEGKYEDGQWSDKVHLQSCLSWRQPGGDINCDQYGAFPGTTSKCTCEYIELGKYKNVLSSRIHNKLRIS